MKEHQRCYGECERVFPRAHEKFVIVDHAGRVEKLIHAELAQHAMSIDQCPNKHKKNGHSEWFDVKEEHAIQVIRKWTEWMRSVPYEQRPDLAENQPKSLNTNCQTCNPAEGKPTTQSPKPKSPGTRGRKASRKGVWRLRKVDNAIMRICFPLTPRQSNENIDEVGSNMRRITIN